MARFVPRVAPIDGCYRPTGSLCSDLGVPASYREMNGHGEVANLLERAGASKNARDSAGRSALDWAATQTPQSPVASHAGER